MQSIAAIEPDAAAHASVARPQGPPFVGRERELGELQSYFESAIAQRASVALVSGEAGIGKTRLVEELARYARRGGGNVIWGQCPQSAPPLWAWIQVSREYLAICDPRTIAAELGGGAALMASVVPEIRELLPNLADAPLPAPTSHGSLRLFDAITSLLKRASAPRPLMVVLDDLQFIDPTSLELLPLLATALRGSRLLIVGIYRTGTAAAELSSMLGGLNCERHYLRLHGLSESDVDALIEESARVPLAKAVARAVFEKTEGNPFFVREVLRTLSEAGDLGDEAEIRVEDLRPPSGVVDAVRRLARELSSETREVLTIAAVLGREFAPEHVDIACAGAASIATALEEAERREIVTVLDDGRYRFVHTLVREALEAEVPPRRRGEILRSCDPGALESPHGETSLSASEPLNAFVRMGDHWALSFDGHVSHVKDSIGLRYLAYLLQKPGRRIPCVDLVMFGEGIQADAISPRLGDKGGFEAGIHQRRGLGDAGELIDSDAEQAYRRRWKDLEDELARARTCNDLGRVDMLTRERDFLVRELTAGVGIYGRSRKAASFAERTRLNVTRAIRSAILRIEAYDRRLSEHLRATIVTGKYCSYTPDSFEARSWSFRMVGGSVAFAVAGTLRR
jgi:hypothetical protein